MNRLLFFIAFTFFAGCQSNTKKETPAKVSGPDTVAMQPKSIGNTTIIDSATGFVKPDLESLGDIKLGLSWFGVLKKIGEPVSKSTATVWGADGLKHRDWTYNSLGLVLNIMTDNDEVERVFSITATSPCTFKTKTGAGIGSTYPEVENLYKKDIDKEQTDKTQIVVGSVYGGIIFSFKNDKVERIFIGAAAE